MNDILTYMENDQRIKQIKNVTLQGLFLNFILTVRKVIAGIVSSRMFDYAREDVAAWLTRRLDSYYSILYIDATFIATRRVDSVSKEAYFTILAVKEDTSREVLAVVNNPTEGSSFWNDIFTDLKKKRREGGWACRQRRTYGHRDSCSESFQNGRYSAMYSSFTEGIPEKGKGKTQSRSCRRSEASVRTRRQVRQHEKRDGKLPSVL